MLVFGGAGIIFGMFIEWAVYALIAFLVPAALLIHNFWSAPEDEKIVQMLFFMRNIALTGVALMALSAF